METLLPPILAPVMTVAPCSSVREGYRDASYQDFNDQVLFGEYSKNINSQAVKMIQAANLKTGDNVEVYGVFSAWDIPQTIPEITPAKIVHPGGQ